MIEIIDCTSKHGYSLVTFETYYRDITCLVFCEVTHETPTTYDEGGTCGGVSILELYLIRHDGSLYDISDSKFESKLEFDYGDIVDELSKY